MITVTFFNKHDLLPERREFPDSCEIVIGRGDGPRLQVKQATEAFEVLCPIASLSERHARLIAIDGAVTIEDLGSRNGTMVRLEAHRAHAPDDKPVWLGPDLAIRIEDVRWILPERLGALSVKALCEFLQSRLESRGVRVEFGPPAPGSLPINGNASHLALHCIAAHRTVDVDDASWVRFVVSAYNSARDAQQAEHESRFTAVSAPRRRALDQARRAARAQLPILLLGPSGVGKELLAQDIHDFGRTRTGAFVAVNCGALSAERLESELFGHARGAYTGAHGERQGLVELADGGTLFLDEIGEMPAAVQSRLLRFLSDAGEYRRMGESRVRRASARIVAATHRDLQQGTGPAAFRADLYYRLAGVRIDIPAPAAEDIERMTLEIAVASASDHGRTLSDETARELARDAARRPWPGNVRQLRFAIERCVQMFDPARTWLENWHSAASLDAPSDSRATSPDPRGSMAQPARVGRLVADALFLTAALRHRARADLARALNVTYQAVDSRLAALRIRLDAPGEIDARLSECSAELRALAINSTELQALFKSALEG